MDVHCFVTAGGRSSRMGKDKAWLEIGGRSMIEHVIGELLSVTPLVSVIANTQEYNRLRLPVLSDVNPGIGPLEAIRTALTNSRANWIVLVACDLPFVTAELLKTLLDCTAGHQAVVPMSAEEIVEPLCAVYSTEALEPVTALIASGERKVSRLFDRVRTRMVPFDELRRLPGSERFFVNVNTLEDYARAIELVS
jgi:molybdopterin-guanine dinucleotide biosynthesis protein A